MNNIGNRPTGITGVMVLAAMLGAPVQAGGKHDTKDLDEALAITEVDRENGIDVFEVCTACHGVNGWGKPDGTFPQIAGQHPKAIINAIKDIRAGNRDNPTMYPYTEARALGSAQDIADMAAYISQLPMTPENGKGPGKNLAHGEKLYKRDCAGCHGAGGEGNAAAGFPRIHGQHFNYLVRQFEWIRDGRRRNANPGMVQVMKPYNHDDAWAVMDYVSRLQPPKDRLAPKGWENPDYD